MPNALPFDDLVIVFFAASGFFGGAALHFTKAKPIVVAIFLATGIAALVFRFLGGIDNTSLTLSSLKLGGTMAALIGSAMLINAALEKQARPVGPFSPTTLDDLVGRWKWQSAKEGWLSYLDFSANNETLTFVGHVEQFKDGQCRRIHDLDEGRARLVEGNRLELSCRVKDLVYGGTYHWVSTDPLWIAPVFYGRLIVPSSDPRFDELRSHTWGIGITKEPT